MLLLEKGEYTDKSWKKRHSTRNLQSMSLDRLLDKDPAVHAILKRLKISHTTTVSASVWNNHLHWHSRAERGKPDLPRVSAADMAVPLGRSHPPPEVLLRRGVQSGWVPEPHKF